MMFVVKSTIFILSKFNYFKIPALPSDGTSSQRLPECYPKSEHPELTMISYRLIKTWAMVATEE